MDAKCTNGQFADEIKSIHAKGRNLDRICTNLVVLLPLIAMYKSPIKILDMGSFLILILFPLLFLHGNKRRVKGISAIVNSLIIYIVYMIMITMLSLRYTVHYTSKMFYVLRMGKNIIYIAFTICIINKRFFDFQQAQRSYNIVVWITTAYIVLQFMLFRIFDYGLPGYIPTLIKSEGYGERISTITTGLYFRPTSLFYEPAHYATYVCTSIILYLFYSGKRNKNIINAGIVTLGIFISTSGQGIMVALMFWGIWLFTKLKGSCGRISLMVMTVAFLISGLIGYLLFTQGGLKIIERWIPRPGEVGAIMARSEGFFLIRELSQLEMLLGCGYGNVPEVFFSSWAFNIWSLGIVGTFIIGIMYLFCIKYSQQKWIVALNMILCVFNTTFMGIYFVFFFSFILADRRGNGIYVEECRNTDRTNICDSK